MTETTTSLPAAWRPYIPGRSVQDFTWRDGPADDDPLVMKVRRPGSLTAGESQPFRDWLRAAIESDQQQGDHIDEQEAPARPTNESLFPALAPLVHGWNLAELVDGEVVELAAPITDGPDAFRRVPPGAVSALIWHFLGVPSQQVEMERRISKIESGKPTAVNAQSDTEADGERAGDDA